MVAKRLPRLVPTIATGIMTTRITDHRVTFMRPFSLPGWEDSWPAGEYTVTTNEELLDTSFPAYHRVSTTIALRRGAETRYVEIVPLELAAALDRDRLAGDSATGREA
jgi:hypothetical protein